MKELSCKNCRRYLGSLEKGKIHRRAVLLCDECYQHVERIMRLDTKTQDMPEFFQDIFK